MAYLVDTRLLLAHPLPDWQEVRSPSAVPVTSSENRGLHLLNISTSISPRLLCSTVDQPIYGFDNFYIIR